MSVFNYEFNNDCPSLKTENFFITFYCGYHNYFPYAEHSHGPPPQPRVKPLPGLAKQLHVNMPTLRKGKI